jgi:hypothetical protein
LRQTKTKTDELAEVLDIERERLNALAASDTARLDVQDAKVAQFRAQLGPKSQQEAALKIRAARSSP